MLVCSVVQLISGLGHYSFSLVFELSNSIYEAWFSYPTYLPAT